jgi:glutamate-ammonia-ligase adenylyltransferase
MISRPNNNYHHLAQLDLNDKTLSERLAAISFADWQAAKACLERIERVSQAGPLFAVSLPALLHALSEAAHPDRVLVSLERFMRNVPDRPALTRQLAEDPRAVELLVTILAGSQFLTEILLRNPEYFTRLSQRQRLARQKSSAEFYQEAWEVIAPLVENETPAAQATTDAFDALRRFQRWQLLRLGAYDLLGLLDIPTVTRQLSNLADSLVQICLHLVAPQSQSDPAEFVVLGMGKLGGRELNYSSDIDLLFLSAESGPAYRPLGQRLIEALTKVTTEGFLYRVDMRLRPWGSTGPLVTSLKSYISYLTQQARLWERQALLKARPIAGNKALGGEFLCQIKPLLFEAEAEKVRSDVRAMKERIETELRRRGRKWGEVKLGEGSIRDVEFVTQYLQLAHGRENPDLHSANTLTALTRLFQSGFLNADAYRILSTGYTFLRPVEHYLQMMRHQQTHTLPDDPEALDHLARRLGFRGTEAGAEFVERYQQHVAAIRTVYRQHFDDEQLERSNNPVTPVKDHLARMSRSYAETFSQAEIEHHSELMSRLNDENLIEVEAVPLGEGRWRITIVGYDYLGELSLICGLMVVYRLNILDGQVFTYHTLNASVDKVKHQEARRKIVDVFTVRPIVDNDHPKSEPLTDAFWKRYGDDLENQLRRLEAGEQETAQRDLINRFANVLRSNTEITTTPLYQIDIRIDIEADDRYTILSIDTPDTAGFLYEFANALALNGVYIARVSIETIGNRVQDILYVADARGRKITTGQKLFELRVATVLVKHFTHLLPQAPNPAAALIHFRAFLGQLFTRPDWPNEIATLIRPEVLDALARLLGVSDFLWNDFLRMQYTNLFPVIRDVEQLAQAKTKRQLQAELEAIMQFAPDEPAQRQSLNEFKDREMFRIDMRHIMGHTTEYGQFSGELSDLAEVVMTVAYDLCCRQLQRQYGEPRQENGQLCPMAVCALGKFGGCELGFASDIELMFIFDGAGQTSGPEVILSNLFYEKLVQLIQNTIQAKREGIFELDLRLRPYGQSGRLAVPLDSFRRYFAPDGPAWDYERQALVKLRPIAGDMTLGEQIVALRDRLIYTGKPFDVAAMRGMRERQVRHLVTAGTINAKFSPGGLVDIEYLGQGLQITHGHDNPALRVTNTRAALAALREAHIISQEVYDQLYEAYNFLRRLINALRMVRGNAKDLTVPLPESEEFAFLARRLNGNTDSSQLYDKLTHHISTVQMLSQRLLVGD